MARVDARFFCEVLAFARQRYEIDRGDYHVSAQLSRLPDPDGVGDAGLPGLLDQFDTRQVLHVTFGSVLDQFGERLLATLRMHEMVYTEMLDAHFGRHLSPFG